ncbi:tetratricopeptide repeat protein [Sphingomonas sp. ID1715]|uniref:tetratricopeptide repeat protein n=1 Tax=Sphingomonas sp. ID1715 TaxID=1656898 RepID=UPI0014877D3F|nr:tetratricopeptide repeat protein [Sphingomonas sp. ID1715]NNM75493.1 tetratricopeptide repeat protein [Sphingomonas sp. ID1715]
MVEIEKTGAATKTRVPPARLALFAAAAIAIVAVGVGVSRNRAPDAAPAPAASASAQPDVGAMISSLEAKLKTDPNNAEGWRMLGWSFFETGRYAESATAYRKATQLKPDNADYWSSLGEALVLAGSGDVPKDASAAFKKALSIDPKDPRSRYFLGVEQDMAGKHAEAIDTWIALLKDTPAGAPWEADVRKTVEQVAEKEKIDVKARLAGTRPPAPTGPAAALNGIPGPSREQMAAASRLPSGAQEEMVRGMVDGLAAKLKADPKQPDRWMMLIRSRMMLGQGREASQALQQAIAANPASRDQLVQAARTLGVPGA